MKAVKRLGAILMALGFLSSLFSCKEDVTKYGDWQSLRLAHYSSVRTDNYNFTVKKADGGMKVSGYCYDLSGEEHRFEDLWLTSGTAFEIIMAKPEKLVTFKGKKKLEPIDGKASNVDTVVHTDGTERNIRLSDETREKLISLIREDVASALESYSHGEWVKLQISFQNDNYSEWYDFEVTHMPNGERIAVGFCSDAEGHRYESTEGIVLSEETVHELRSLWLEQYAVVKKAESSDSDVTVLDGSSGGLTLIYKDGAIEKKEFPEVVDAKIVELLRKEFIQKADKQ
jgi:hypothetical protein